MQRAQIALDEFKIDIYKSWDKDWFLLASGKNEPGEFNTMTVAWGSFGVMWNKPIAMIVVRPSRYTHEFLERSGSFTLCAFPPEYRKALSFHGANSGRDVDKVAETGLTPIPSTRVSAPGFDEARLIVECRKIYEDEFHPTRFLDPAIESHYGGSDYHSLYFGEVLAVYGTDQYRT
jgi:flavin reductase (DIM6/NTAB) family NADH-FMN oxidoreductase RutF